MDEYVDIWEASGNPTGRQALKSEAHRHGWFHPTVHIWFYTTDGRVLLQKRASSKETFPNLWDVSVAGHIHAGEAPLEAALREIEEELGLVVQEEQLEFIGRFKGEHFHPGDIVDREFHLTYLSKLEVSLNTLRPDGEEVSALKLVPLLRLAEEVWGLASPHKYVPHGREYYSTVIKALQSSP